MVVRFSTPLNWGADCKASIAPHSPEWSAAYEWGVAGGDVCGEESSVTWFPVLSGNNESDGKRDGSLPVLAKKDYGRTKEECFQKGKKGKGSPPSESLGTKRLGSAQFGETSLSSAPFGSNRHGSVQSICETSPSALLGSNRHGSAQFGETSLPPAPIDPNRQGSVLLGSPRPPELVRAEHRGPKFAPRPPGVARSRSARSLGAAQTGNEPNNRWRKLSSPSSKPVEPDPSPVITRQTGWVAFDVSSSPEAPGAAPEVRPLRDSEKARTSERLPICCGPAQWLPEEHSAIEEISYPDEKEDQSEGGSGAHGGMGQTDVRCLRTTGSPPQPFLGLSKRKLSPSALQNPLAMRSLKNHRRLGTNKGAEEIVQSDHGNLQNFPSLDEDKSVMINKWLSDVNAKTANITRGVWDRAQPNAT